MLNIITLSNYIDQIQEEYGELYIEKRLNSSKIEDQENEIIQMLNQINSDYLVIENLINISKSLIETIQIKSEEIQDYNDHNILQQKKLEEELNTERDQIKQYQNLYQEKCQEVKEQFEVIQDFEQQVNKLQNQITILENQNIVALANFDNGDRITAIIQQQEQQLIKNQNHIIQLQDEIIIYKNDIQDMKKENYKLNFEIEEQCLKIKQNLNELQQLKYDKQQQDVLIQSLEQDLKINSEIIIDYEIQIDNLKNELRYLHNLKAPDTEQFEQRRTSSFGQINNIIKSQYETEKISSKDLNMLINNQHQSNLKIQLPLLSYRQSIYKYKIPEVSERYEQSISDQKNNSNNEQKIEVSTFLNQEISNDKPLDEQLQNKQQQNIQKIEKQYQSQTARLSYNQQAIPQIINDMQNRITVSKKKKIPDISNNSMKQYYELLEKSGFQSQTKQYQQLNIYQIFFELLVQCVKLNSSNFDDIYSIDTTNYYYLCINENIPYFKWQNWIQEKLNIN